MANSNRPGNGNGGSGTNTLNITSGELDANLEKISSSLDKGVITQSGGTNALTLNTATAGFFIGGTQAFPGNGTYSLSGGGAVTVTGSGTTWNNSGSVYVGGDDSAAGGNATGGSSGNGTCDRSTCNSVSM